MAASSSVHSSALNFMSSLQNGVDPRTGLYTISIDLPEVAANELRGPNVALGFSYSPLNTVDSGYGLGWNLKLSQYTPGDQILSVSTGETFRVTDTGAKGQLLMRDKKLDSFHFYRVDARRFRVVHKSGVVEILELLDIQNRIALPTEIYAPSGHRITLEYRPFGNGHMILTAIKDAADQVLLSVGRPANASEIEFLLHPFTGPGAEPLARFLMVLQGSAGQVARIVLPTDNQASWRFKYGQFEELFCITSVDNPVGGHEDIFYQDQGHAFPAGSGRRPLPRVTRHVISPGFGQPQMDVRYSYPHNRNFLGSGLSIPWADDGYDNLFKYLGDYDYTTLETLWVEGQPARSIERTFNRFHLLAREMTTQNNNCQTVESTYAYEPGKPYAQQPNDCQLARAVKTSWALLDNSTRYRSESVTSRYDTHGNLIEQIQPNGVIELSQWYSAAGEDGCPPDSEGFVRCLKEKTLIPAQGQGQAPTLSTRFRYRALPALPDSGLPDWVVTGQETLVDSSDLDQELQRTQIDYLDDPEDSFLHGRIARQRVTLNGLTTTTGFDYIRVAGPDGSPALQITATLSTDFDSASSVTVEQQSLLTSRQVLMEMEGVRTRYEYDALGRLVRESASPDTPFEASRLYHYFLCADVGEQAEQVQTSSRQINTRVLLDGLGRRVHEEQDHIDPALPTRFKRNYSARFNAWGQLEEETEYDWLENGTRELALTTRLAYDDWAQQSCAIGPDGVQNHSCTDPIGNAEFVGPVQRSWQQSAAQPPLIAALTEVRLNPFGKPAQTLSLTADGQQVGVQQWFYDGLGRCVEHRDELDQITTFEYDAWSRLTRSRLPNQALVEREYAPHSNSELTAALRVSRDGVSFALAGRQQFDGLLRLTRLETGSRVQYFDYEPGHTQLKTRTTAAGASIDYRYNLAVSHQPTSTTAPDEQARFDYDPVSARLLLTGNEQGTREYDYDPTNELRTERWTSGGQTWETSYLNSSRGRLLQRTEQKQNAGAGLPTRYGYDGFGRLESLEQDQLRASFEYDGLGRVQRTTTLNVSTGATVVTGLDYDDQGREILRTLAAEGQPARTLEQRWRADGLLMRRHLREDDMSLLEEQFDYDARGRLSEHVCAGITLPRDALGREIEQQIFSFDALDNISVSVTRFANGDTERARYFYDGGDPFQLASIAYTPPRATPDPVFSYDGNGNQLNDEQGRRLSYDSQNRLTEVQGPDGQSLCRYAYDGHDHLVASRQNGADEIVRFYQGPRLTSSSQAGVATQYLHHNERPLGQQQARDAGATLLLLTDANATVLGEAQQHQLRSAVYNAYGEQHADEAMQCSLGFNGELRDSRNGWYLLGNGYRAYNPGVMRFHSPDGLSPFGAGGINPYTYCLGNPIALRDPTGASAIGYSGRPRRPDEGEVQGLPGGGGGLEAWVGVAVGVVMTTIGVVSIVGSLGTLAPVAAPFIIAGQATTIASIAIATVATGLAAVSTVFSTVAAVDNSNEEAMKIAFWTGIGGLAVGLGGAAVLKGFSWVAGMASAARGTATAGAKGLPSAGLVADRFGSARHVAGWSKPPGTWSAGAMPKPTGNFGRLWQSMPRGMSEMGATTMQRTKPVAVMVADQATPAPGIGSALSQAQHARPGPALLSDPTFETLAAQRNFLNKSDEFFSGIVRLRAKVRREFNLAPPTTVR